MTLENVQVAESSQKVEWRANFLLYKKFVDEHPNIHFRSLTQLRLPPGMDIPGADFTMAMVGDTAPDVFMCGPDDLSKYVEQGFVQPLDDYVKDWKYKDRVLGPWKSLVTRRGKDGKEHIYALPFVVMSRSLYWNRKRFRDVGLDPYRGPADWNELWSWAVMLTDKTEDEFGEPRHFGVNFPLAGWFYSELIFQAGGSWAKQNPDGSWRCTCNEPEAVEALDFLKKLAYGEWKRNGKTYYGVMDLTRATETKGSSGRTQLRSEARDPMQTGKLAMSAGGLAYGFNERFQMDPELYGVCRMPKGSGPNGRYANVMSGNFLAIKSTIKSKAVRDAAWEYISYMCGDDAEREKVKIFVENGVAKYVNPVLLEKYGYGQYAKLVPPDWRRAYEEIFTKDVVIPPAPPGAAAIVSELENPATGLYSNRNQDSKAALDEVYKVVSRSYLYSPTKDQMDKNRRLAWLIVGLLGGMFFAGSGVVLKTYVRENLSAELQKEYTRKVGRSRHIIGWLIMAPAVLSVLVWQYVPVAWGSLMAFQDVQLIGESKWVGIDNFIHVAVRPLFWTAAKNTLVFVFLSLAMGFFAPVILALLLSEIPKGKTLFRTLYYLPSLTVGIVTILLWKQFYAPTEQGFMNQVLAAFNHTVLANINLVLEFLHLPLKIPMIPMQQWIWDPKLAMACCILPGVWAGAGPGCIIYLAALKAVPEELYDAADLDGAGIIQKTRAVTLPTLYPLILINFLGAFIGAFHGAGNILVMTGGGPNHATHVMALEIFTNAYVLMKYGYATAIAWMLASLLIGFTVLQMRVFSKMKFSTAEQQ